MRLFCIDPGEQTGVVIYHEPVNIFVLATVSLEACTKDIQFLEPAIVIIENKPKFHDWNDKLVGDFATLRDVCSEVGSEMIFITPGLWKPIAKAQKWRVPRAKTPHEKDAYNILRYFFFSHFKLDIGEDICLHKEKIKTFSF